MMITSQQVIDQTKKWINDVVIGCNLCPFASNVMKNQSVQYRVEKNSAFYKCLDSFSEELTRLDNNPNIETSFLIFQDSFTEFDDYLYLVSLAAKLLKQKGYEGIYQLASFHPLYRFANSAEDDAANYTNRSIYPMLHILREASIDKALEKYKDPEDIPTRNINFSRKKGLTYMKMLRDACMNS
jgi:hypothetical protein